MQLKKSKYEAVAMKESSRQKTIALKKASKIYKQRIEHFTGDMENLTSQIREQVSYIHSSLKNCFIYLVNVLNFLTLSIIILLEKLYSY